LVFIKDVLRGGPLCQQIENVFNGQPSSLDDRLASHHLGIKSYSIKNALIRHVSFSYDIWCTLGGIGLSHVTLMIQFVNKPKTPEREIPPQRSLFGDFRD
jgi:hypothetical protein